MAAQAYIVPRLEQALRIIALLASRGEDGASLVEMQQIVGSDDHGVAMVIAALEAAKVVVTEGGIGAEGDHDRFADSGTTPRARLASTAINPRLEDALHVHTLCSIGLQLPELADHHAALTDARDRSGVALGSALDVATDEPPILPDVRALAGSGRRVSFDYRPSSADVADRRSGWIEHCRLVDGEWRFDLVNTVRRQLRVDRIVGELHVESAASASPACDDGDRAVAVPVVLRCDRCDVGVFTPFEPDERWLGHDLVELCFDLYRPDARLARILRSCVNTVEVIEPTELRHAQAEGLQQLRAHYQIDTTGTAKETP